MVIPERLGERKTRVHYVHCAGRESHYRASFAAPNRASGSLDTERGAALLPAGAPTGGLVSSVVGEFRVGGRSLQARGEPPSRGTEALDPSQQHILVGKEAAEWRWSFQEQRRQQST